MWTVVKLLRKNLCIRSLFGFIKVSLFLTVFCGLICADDWSPAPSFQHLDRSNGLSQSVVNCIFQDREGFLWFGTQDGLNRFDGHSFTVYRPNAADPLSLPHGDVSALAQEASGAIWVGTNGGGLSRFSPKLDQFEPVPLTLPRESSLCEQVQALAVHANRIWVGTLDGLGCYSPEERSWRWMGWAELRLDAKGPCDVRALHADDAGRLWVGTNAGLAMVENGQGASIRFEKPEAKPHSQGIYAIQAGQQGELLLATDEGPRGFDLTHFTWYEPGPKSSSPIHVRALLRARNGSLWAATRGLGLFRWRNGAASWEQFQEDPADLESISHNEMICLLEDQSGLIWAGTYGGGANFFDPLTAYFRHWRDAGSGKWRLSSKDIGAIAVDRDGWLWIGGSESGGIDGFHADTGQRLRMRHDPKDAKGLGPGAIGAICQDPKGRLWVGTLGGGLHEIVDRGKGRVIRYRRDPSQPKSLSSDLVRTLFPASSGALWVGTMGGGLNLFHPDTGKFDVFQQEPNNFSSLSNNQVYCLLVDRNNVLWVGTIGGGLNRYGETGFARFLHQQEDPGSIGDNQVTALHQDHDGQLWVGTYGAGLQAFDPVSGRFRQISVKDGLPSPEVYGILEVGDWLWLSSNHGLARLNRKSLRVERIQRGSGLLQEEFNGGAFASAPWGEFFFGSVNGIVSFMPEDNMPKRAPAPLVITRMKADQTRLPFATVALGRRLGVEEALQPLTVPSESRLEVSLAVLDYANPLGYRYEYRLLGAQKDWQSIAAEQRSVSFQHLSPGRYVFEARAAQTGSTEYIASQAVALNVPRPFVFWLKWALYLLLALAACLIWMWLGRRQKRGKRQMLQRLEQLELLKDRILTNTSQELRTPLNGMIGLAESLLGGAAGEPNPALKANLEMIVSNGLRLAEMVDNLLDISSLKRDALKINPRPLALREAVEDVVQVCRVEAENKGLWLYNCISADLPPVSVDEARFEQILKNLLQNAIRVTHIGKISIEAERKSNFIEIMAKDTGPGLEQTDEIFEPFSSLNQETSEKGIGLGLAVARRLVELSGGRMGFTSQREMGATFWFTLPIAESQSELLSSQTVQADGFARMGSKSQSARILVVDDEPVNRQVLLNFLSLSKYQTFEAEDSESATEMLGLHGPIDLILLDIMMPHVSGIEFCRELRKRFSVNDLPIIFITAKNQPEDLVSAFAAGANDYVSKPISKSELLSRVEVQLRMLHLHRNLEQMVSARTMELQERNRELAQSNAKLGDLNRQLEEAALMDPLTGLHNRRFFVKYVPREVAGVLRMHQAAQRNKAPRPEGADLLFIMVDIDFFKSINDQYGHEAGDRVLVQFSAILGQVFRESDMLLRWGGEEFLVISRATDTVLAPNLVERLRQIVEETPFEIGMGQSVHRTCSIGYAPFPFFENYPNAMNWEQVVNLADRALYAAKKSQRNTWVGLRGGNHSSAPQAELVMEALNEQLELGNVQLVHSLPEGTKLVL